MNAAILTTSVSRRTTQPIHIPSAKEERPSPQSGVCRERVCLKKFDQVVELGALLVRQRPDHQDFSTESSYGIPPQDFHPRVAHIFINPSRAKKRPPCI